MNGEAGAMILGDNIFYGNGFSKILNAAAENAEKNNRATVFGYYVQDPERFGVVAFVKTVTQHLSKKNRLSQSQTTP